MKVGDLVKWIGWENQRVIPSATGVILKIIWSGVYGLVMRVDVAWGDGTIGQALYSNTIEVINEVGS